MTQAALALLAALVGALLLRLATAFLFHPREARALPSSEPRAPDRPRRLAWLQAGFLAVVVASLLALSEPEGTVLWGPVAFAFLAFFAQAALSGRSLARSTLEALGLCAAAWVVLLFVLGFWSALASTWLGATLEGVGHAGFSEMVVATGSALACVAVPLGLALLYLRRRTNPHGPVHSSASEDRASGSSSGEA